MPLKILTEADLIKRTAKAKLFQKGDHKQWIPNRAIVDMKYRQSGYDVVVADWLETNGMFREVSLSELIHEKAPADVKFVTNIKEEDFPNDLVDIQREAVDFSVKLKTAIIWLWTGCGKTKIGIEIANILFKHDKIKRLYWITPQYSRALRQLQDSFNRWLDKDIEVKIVSINRFSKRKDLSIALNDVVIIDECHRVKNGIIVNNEAPDCKLSDNIRKSLFNAGYVYGLTATSCLNGILDLFGIFYCLNKRIIIEEGKKARYYLNIKNKKAVGVKSMLNFIGSVTPYIFHRSKLDYDNRRLTEKEYPVFLNPEQAAKMNNLYNRSKSLSRKESIVDTYINMIQCMCRVGGDNLKIDNLKKILNSIPQDDQAIIFGFTVNGRYSDMALMRQALKETGDTYIELHGDQSNEDNALAIHLFREGRYRVLLASYGCGSEMLDFPNANHVILFGHSLNPIHRFQGIGRIDRLTQKKQIFAYSMYVQNSVEGYIDNLYKKKIDLTLDLSVYMKNEDHKLLNNELS